jgi:hypothetical protein
MLRRDKLMRRGIGAVILIAMLVVTIGWAGVVYANGGMFSLYQLYAGESTDCVWQSQAKCPPYVTYYNDTQRQTLKLIVKGNKIFNARGRLFDTSGGSLSHSGVPAAIFTMDDSGTIYASNVNVVFLFHHSTIAGGQPVAAAGELMVEDGIIKTVTNCSGHYRPNGDLVKDRVTKSLRDQGYTRAFTFERCN